MYVARNKFHGGRPYLGLIPSAAPFIGCMLALFYSHAMEGKRKMPFTLWPLALGRGIFFAAIFINSAFWYALVAVISQVLISLSGPPYATVVKEIYPIDLGCP